MRFVVCNPHCAFIELCFHNSGDSDFKELPGEDFSAHRLHPSMRAELPETDDGRRDGTLALVPFEEVIRPEKRFNATEPQRSHLMRVAAPVMNGGSRELVLSEMRGRGVIGLPRRARHDAGSIAFSSEACPRA
jgi:hypothetical protein